MTSKGQVEEQFDPENELEEELLAAQQGKLNLDEFMVRLLKSDLFIPSATPFDDDLAKATPLIYKREGKQLLTVFTSLERAKTAQSKASYCLSMNARELVLRMPPEHGVVINPGYRVGLELDPVAVSDLKARAQQVQRTQ